MPIRRLLAVLLVLLAGCGVGDAGAGEAVDEAAAALGAQLAAAPGEDPVVIAAELDTNALDSSTDEELVVRISRTVDGGTWKGSHTAVHCYRYDLSDPKPERIDCTGAVPLDARTFTTVVRD